MVSLRYEEEKEDDDEEEGDTDEGWWWWCRIFSRPFCLLSVGRINIFEGMRGMLIYSLFSEGGSRLFHKKMKIKRIYKDTNSFIRRAKQEKRRKKGEENRRENESINTRVPKATRPAPSEHVTFNHFMDLTVSLQESGASKAVCQGEWSKIPPTPTPGKCACLPPPPRCAIDPYFSIMAHYFSKPWSCHTSRLIFLLDQPTV